MADQQLLQAILEELKTANKLAGISITKNLKSEEQIGLLSQAGVKPKDIADILGKTANYVSVTLHKIRKTKIKVESNTNDGDSTAKSKDPKKAK